MIYKKGHIQDSLYVYTPLKLFNNPIFVRISLVDLGLFIVRRCMPSTPLSIKSRI